MSAPDVRDLPEPPVPGATAPDPEAPAPRERTTAAERIVELALQGYRLGVTPEGDPFAVALTSKPHVAMPLRGRRRGLQKALAKDYRESTSRVAGQQALADALLTLDGIAQDTAPTELHLRVAEHAGALYVDVGDVAGTVVCITQDGWSLLTDAPVMFSRTELSGVLATPARGGDVSRLFSYLNVPEDDRPLVLAWLVAAYMPDMPHPILTLTGEQGTGKSTATRLLVELCDPSPVPLRKPPRDADGMVTAFAGSWVVALDNLSAVNEWLSDSLCRVVTGEGDVRRQLYTDGGLSVFAFRRALILTGIDFAGLRGDLAERMLLAHLERIPDTRRRTEQELTTAWRSDLPVILGGLLDLVADVLRVLPDVQLAASPRMADFARVLATVDLLLGTKGLARYADQSAEIATDTLAASPFLERMLSLRLDFAGTAAELLAQVTPHDPDWKKPRDWPDARNVTTTLRRNAPALRAQGWTVDELGKDRNGTLRWTVVCPEVEPSSLDLLADALAEDEPF